MPIADALVDAFRPWLTPDLEQYLRSVGGMFEEVEGWVEDTEDHEGWTKLLDPTRIPVAGLPYLAQYVGEQLPAGLTEAAQREWVKDAPNQRRGTPLSIFLAAQRTLTGNRVVVLKERTDGTGATDVDHITVHTYTAETPDPVIVERDVRSMTPADIVLHYSMIAGATWDLLNDTSPLWSNVKANYATWGEARSAVIGSSSYSRPRP